MNFVKTSDSAQEKESLEVTRAEAAVAMLLAKMNLSLSSADTFTTVFKDIFHDSKIAGKVQCSRNKTTAIIRNIAQDQQQNLVDRMKRGPFSLSTDYFNCVVSMI